MKSLNTYLPKDISNIILDYLYKPDIEKLNKEYHDTYRLHTGGILNISADLDLIVDLPSLGT